MRNWLRQVSDSKTGVYAQAVSLPLSACVLPLSYLHQK